METINLSGNHAVTGALPLYRSVEALSPDRHGALALRTAMPNFRFAASSPTLFVTVDEFEKAMMDYPIVFYGPERRAVIVTGLTADRNLFISSDGRYAPGAYIPAYLRRHPFVLAREDGESAERSIVCIDVESDRLVDRGAPDSTLLFEDGEPSAAARDAIRFAEAYRDAELRTEAFAALLDEHDLLEPRQAAFRPSEDSEPIQLLDFAAVSQERLAALDMARFEDLRQAGALAPIYAHLFSAAKWDVLPIWNDA